VRKWRHQRKLLHRTVRLMPMSIIMWRKSSTGHMAVVGITRI
jgi:hypothetical protein